MNKKDGLFPNLYNLSDLSELKGRAKGFYSHIESLITDKDRNCERAKIMMFSGGERQAQLHYLSGDYEVLSHGSYVLCAVSGEKIPLDELKYWSAPRQEAYASCEISYRRELECDPHLRKLLGTTIKA